MQFLCLLKIQRNSRCLVHRYHRQHHSVHVVVVVICYLGTNLGHTQDHYNYNISSHVSVGSSLLIVLPFHLKYSQNNKHISNILLILIINIMFLRKRCCVYIIANLTQWAQTMKLQST